MALSRRNVELSWFTPNSKDLLLEVDAPNTCVIGFIVNDINEKSIFRRVPLLGGWFFGDGRHWYAITRLQRGGSSHDNAQKKWKVLDSMNEKAEFLDTDALLLELLCATVEQGGNVFRATTRIET